MSTGRLFANGWPNNPFAAVDNLSTPDDWGALRYHGIKLLCASRFEEGLSMPSRTCFVVMAIGDYAHADFVVTEADLRRRYDDLIKEALLKADPSLDVTRADDIAMPGTISSDVLTRLMHSDVVVADITYPNPNVYYEIGLRHACRAGTILIRDREGPTVPFDLSHQRHIEYENSASGLKDLADRFRAYLDFLKRSPGSPDNHFLELAKLMRYAFPRYEEPAQEPAEVTALMAMLKSPHMLDLFMRQASGEQVDENRRAD